MRFTYCLILFLASSLLFALTTSCGQNSKGESNKVSDSLVMESAAIIPISDISLKGTWKSKDNPLYPILEFKGKSTIVMKTIMGPYASSYERDEEFIRVRTDKSDLLFEIVSEDSLIGSGYSKGIWVKEK